MKINDQNWEFFSLFFFPPFNNNAWDCLSFFISGSRIWLLNIVDSWTTRLGLQTLHSFVNPCIAFDSSQNFTAAYSHLSGLIPGHPSDTKSTDAQSIKWRRTIHRVGPVHLQIPSNGLILIHGGLNVSMQNPRIQRADCVFIEKYLWISGPMQFKPVLFKGQR